MKLNEIYYPLFSISLLGYPSKETIVIYVIVGNIIGLMLTFLAWNTEDKSEIKIHRSEMK